MGGHVSPPTILLRSGQYTSYCNAVLFKLGLNRKMYSWVVQFLNYFISVSERDVDFHLVSFCFFVFCL